MGILPANGKLPACGVGLTVRGSGLPGGEDAACDLVWQPGMPGFEPGSTPA
jgi:hypothetical protein